MKTVIVINKEGMGHGDVELGKKVLVTFFTKAPSAFRELEAIVFFNGGVQCLAEGSACLQPLSVLEEQGVDLIGCGTCVDAYGLRDKIKVGDVSSMDLVLAELEKAEKVITL